MSCSCVALPDELRKKRREGRSNLLEWKIMTAAVNVLHQSVDCLTESLPFIYSPFPLSFSLVFNSRASFFLSLRLCEWRCWAGESAASASLTSKERQVHVWCISPGYKLQVTSVSVLWWFHLTCKQLSSNICRLYFHLFSFQRHFHLMTINRSRGLLQSLWSLSKCIHARREETEAR